MGAVPDRALVDTNLIPTSGRLNRNLTGLNQDHIFRPAFAGNGKGIRRVYAAEIYGFEGDVLVIDRSYGTVASKMGEEQLGEEGDEDQAYK